MTISIAAQQLSFEIPEQPFVPDTYGLVPTKIRTRFCPTCRLELPVREFRGKLHGSSIVRTYCKKCSTRIQGHWVQNNRERHNAGVRRRYSSDPESGVIRMVNTRVRKLGIKGQLTVHEWREVKDLYGNRCAYCGSADFPLQIDHLWPLSLNKKGLEVSKFATNDADNILPCCGFCNRAKSDKPFIIMLGWKHGLLG